MRVTMPVVSWGDRWRPTVPRIDLDRCYPPDGNGGVRFDEGEFRSQIAHSERVQVGSEDRGVVLAFAAIMLSSINDWMDDNTRENAHLPGLKRTVARFEKREGHGQTAFVRLVIDRVVITHKGRRVANARVRVTCDDRGIVQTERWDYDFALLVADFARCYSDRYAERGDPPLVMGEGMAELIAEVDRRHVEDEAEKRREEANAKREHCPNRVGEHCTPAQFACPCYRDGKCVEAKEVGA